mmetsp:Transcript_41410/g.118448  ORF Transcript_41410/g.118448 Transcript_41410/m.118448 type:complete len:91 (+) Transcript_41410:831-1103(+)
MASNASSATCVDLERKRGARRRGPLSGATSTATSSVGGRGNRNQIPHGGSHHERHPAVGLRGALDFAVGTHEAPSLGHMMNEALGSAARE